MFLLVTKLAQYRLQNLYKKGKTEYYNIACSFDIETSSFLDSNGEKTAILYHWQIQIEEYQETGRDNYSLVSAFSKLQKVLKLNKTRKLVLYVHNLGFEFNFIRKYFNITKMFFVAPRKPL